VAFCVLIAFMWRRDREGKIGGRERGVAVDLEQEEGAGNEGAKCVREKKRSRKRI